MGAIPIAIAACIAIAAILLLQQVDQARNGAASASTVYQTLLNAVMARHEYLQAEPEQRTVLQRRFFELVAQAEVGLEQLRRLQPGDSRLDEAEHRLVSYAADMRKLAELTGQIDTLVRDVSARAATLGGYSDQARDRQHAVNVDNSASLEKADATMRDTRDIVDAAYAMRILLATIDLQRATRTTPGPSAIGDGQLSLNMKRVKSLATMLSDRLKAVNAGDASGSFTLDEPLLERVAQLEPPADWPEAASTMSQTLLDAERWTGGVVEVFTARFRAAHQETARLLHYAVQAQETELATETIATKLLKQNYRSAAALARRDDATARAILEGGERLTDILAALPIAPSVHSSMVAAYRLWLEGLRTTTDMLARQNALAANMDRASTEMIEAARTLAARFGSDADRTARSIRWILVLGAVGGLLFGGSAAALAARSITVPLIALQTEIVRRAHDPQGGPLHRIERRDELGDIARAANVFLAEIGRRERSLRAAKQKADDALDRLQRTQAELIRAEKLASLGQLVAGVAHEINTPIGVALTTASAVDDEARIFNEAVVEGRVSRRVLDRMVERTREGLDLLTRNLARSADLIQSFKQVAADQVSGQEREFFVQPYLHELLTSLGPLLRKAGLTQSVSCSEKLTLTCAPGALSQVITNLVVNATQHAFDADAHGSISIVAAGAEGGGVRLVVSDDGRGIPRDSLQRIFDPFFTTRRSEGSTGLGLHIVWNIVTNTLAGHIGVESELGRGTRFIIDLPRHASARA